MVKFNYVNRQLTSYVTFKVTCTTCIVFHLFQKQNNHTVLNELHDVKLLSGVCTLHYNIFKECMGELTLKKVSLTVDQ